MERIRKAEKKDAFRIAEIVVFNYRTFFYPIFKDDEWYFKNMQVKSVADEMLSNPNILSHTYIYDDGIIKAMIRVEDTEIKKLFVDPFFQCKKIGDKLINFAIKNLNAKTLWTLEKNTRAINFYNKHGFMQTGEKKFEEDTTEYLVKLGLTCNQPIKRIILNEDGSNIKTNVEQ